MLGLRKMYFPLSLDLGAKSRNKGPVEFWQDVDYVRMGSLSSTNVEKSNIVLSSEAETMTVRGEDTFEMYLGVSLSIGNT